MIFKLPHEEACACVVDATPGLTTSGKRSGETSTEAKAELVSGAPDNAPKHQIKPIDLIFFSILNIMSTTVKKIYINLDDTGSDLVITKAILNKDSSTLDRESAHQVESFDKRYNKLFKDVPKNYVKYFRRENTITHNDVIGNDLSPYAITFTLPSEYMMDVNDAVSVRLRDYQKVKDQPPHRQVSFMNSRIEDWLKKFRRSMRGMHQYFDIHSYELYHEFTQQGLIHTHGLLLCNNNYYTGTSDIMANLWVRTNPGRKDLFTGVKKSSMKRNRDHAFDKCNHIPNWRKYITKESSEWYQKPCYYVPVCNTLISYDC